MNKTSPETNHLPFYKTSMETNQLSFIKRLPQQIIYHLYNVYTNQLPFIKRLRQEIPCQNKTSQKQIIVHNKTSPETNPLT